MALPLSRSDDGSQQGDELADVVSAGLNDPRLVQVESVNSRLVANPTFWPDSNVIYLTGWQNLPGELPPLLPSGETLDVCTVNQCSDGNFLHRPGWSQPKQPPPCCRRKLRSSQSPSHHGSGTSSRVNPPADVGFP